MVERRLAKLHPDLRNTVAAHVRLRQIERDGAAVAHANEKEERKAATDKTKARLDVSGDPPLAGQKHKWVGMACPDPANRTAAKSASDSSVHVSAWTATSMHIAAFLGKVAFSRSTLDRPDVRPWYRFDASAGRSGCAHLCMPLSVHNVGQSVASWCPLYESVG